jgi:hypothetical protein
LAVKPDGSKVYSSRGQIWSNDLSTIIGSFSPSGEEIEYSEILNRFYISAADQVVEFDADFYSPKRNIQLEGTAGVARINSTGRILYVSTSVGISAINIQTSNSYLPCITQSDCFQGYNDYFDDPEIGWPIYQDEHYLFEYLCDEYRIMLKNADWWAAASPDYQAVDLFAGVEVRNLSGLFGSTSGLLQGWGEFISDGGLETYCAPCSSMVTAKSVNYANLGCRIPG